MLAEPIIVDAARELNDTAYVRWAKDELIGFLNDGQREIVKFRPNATSILKSVQLVAGVNQIIPIADGYRFLALTANRGSAGETYGRNITFVELDSLNQHDSTWRARDGATEIIHYSHDTLEPKSYFCFPPVHATTAVWVELKYSRLPKDVPTATVTPDFKPKISVIDVNDIHKEALIAYMIHRAFRRHTDTISIQKAATYYALFETKMGVIQGKDALLAPISRTDPHTNAPARPASVET